ncbi:hypothetical protein TOPH_03958 [Tolypocladium ophioglossoides CBS 100239]|uniref:DUF6546 domain-containing protein n=1 Tax=Tolypocladium ophioglossoides (strain CBS 100239) TaxID=1163406 RepID=A0A0L0NB38_TOLOC|nr:hypothetical protein TOPH_03958 [Tolypocladium ophioglossoides CBS 100239]
MADRCSVPRCHGMILRNSIRTKTSCWMSLPAEIRLLILEAITFQKYPGWASLACVCKEWQLFIEKRNFRQLKLRVPCLDDFERIIIRQRDLVRHIWFDIELPKYTCRCCDRYEPDSLLHNSSIIRNGIWKLFSILSTWKSANGLTLELNAHSPSDSEHWFKDFHFASDDEGNEAETSIQEIGSRWHDPQHGWINGQQVKTPPRSAIFRLFEMIDMCFQQKLPQVDTVTCFIIRRQLRRWLPPVALWLILDKLCRLEHMIYEPWWACGGEWQSTSHDSRSPTSRSTTDVWITEFLLLVQKYLPKSLKSLLVFEDFNDDLAAALGKAQLSGHLYVDAARIVDPRIGAAFASRSLFLKQLSVSYMANAEDFFQACMRTWTWQHLQSLALTSQLLQYMGNRQETYALLCSAGVTALQMPRLHTLVLWNGRKGNACAFIYHADRDCAHITWRSTWDLELSPHVVKVWQCVAFKFHSFELKIDKQRIQGAIGSHGDAIHHLDLPCRVVAPASLWQIRREGEAGAQHK